METDNRCVACGEIIPEGRQICLNCGEIIPEDRQICLNCGEIIPEDRQIYLNCEHSIQTDIPGLVICQLDNRSKDDDMVCKKYERNLKYQGGTSMKYIANLIVRTFRVLIAQFSLWLFRKSTKKIER